MHAFTANFRPRSSDMIRLYTHEFQSSTPYSSCTSRTSHTSHTSHTHPPEPEYRYRYRIHYYEIHYHAAHPSSPPSFLPISAPLPFHTMLRYAQIPSPTLPALRNHYSKEKSWWSGGDSSCTLHTAHARPPQFLPD